MNDRRGFAGQSFGGSFAKSSTRYSVTNVRDVGRQNDSKAPLARPAEDVGSRDPRVIVPHESRSDVLFELIFTVCSTKVNLTSNRVAQNGCPKEYCVDCQDDHGQHKEPAAPSRMSTGGLWLPLLRSWNDLLLAKELQSVWRAACRRIDCALN